MKRDWLRRFKHWGDPLSDLNAAEREIKRLIDRRRLLKLQIKDISDEIEQQFAIINKVKELLKC